MLTPKQNYLNYLNGEEYEWIPCSYDQKLFMPEIVPDNIARGTVIQQKPFDRSLYGGYDWFGVHWTFDPTACGMGGSMEDGILFEDINDWKDYVRFPDLSKLDWEKSAEENKEFLTTDQILSTTIYTGFFERLISFIGFSEALVALIDEDSQDSVKELFDALADFYIELVSYMKRYYGLGMLDIHDDWGSQRGPLMSIETHREVIAPYVRKFAEGVRKIGVLPELHSCGKLDLLMPSLIETGVFTWRGQQELNDKKALVDQYGDRFVYKVMVTEDFSDDRETVQRKAADLYELYKGKKIILDYPRWLSPEDSRILAEFARSHK
ncbi:MAG: methyltransferase [Parasporobacterium sp.]|nr:methyltransferase [Parasporobacterium sp.]